LVNSWENANDVKKRLKIINRNRLKGKQIKLPNVSLINGDKLLSQIFPSKGPPQHVWINATGKVLAITYPYNATEKNVRAALNGEKLNLSEKNYSAGPTLLENGLFKPQDSSNLFSSGFISYDPIFGMGSVTKKDSTSGMLRKTFLGYSVILLYKAAFLKTGEQRIRFLNEIKNKEIYDEPRFGDLIDSWKKQYCFGYELQMRLKDEKDWRKYMQEDLNRYFGSLFNIEGKIEKRNFRAWVLVKSAKDLVKGSKIKDSSSEWKNMPFKYTVVRLREGLENLKAGYLFIDETGINGDLAMSIRLIGDLKDVQNVRSQLNQYGLEIIERDRQVDVFVICDKKSGLNSEPIVLQEHSSINIRQ
jgi:hypothetical protein